MDDLDMAGRFSVILAPMAFTTFDPNITTTPGDIEHLPQGAYVRVLPLIRHQSIFISDPPRSLLKVFLRRPLFQGRFTPCV
jgi:hypothetical protein